MIEAIKHPQVKMITHPANYTYPVELERVVEAAVEYNVILEANASSFDSFRVGRRGDEKMSLQLCRLIKENGALLSLNSDAHFHTEVGDITFLHKIVQKAGLTENDIINSSAVKIYDFLKLKR
jgi:putative hydrolase